MTTSIVTAQPDSLDATTLIGELDALIEPLYPVESRNGYTVAQLLLEGIAFFVIYVDGAPAGCAGVKLFGARYGEVKRMYVRPQYRGMGLAAALLKHLEAYTAAHGIKIFRLETGIHQHEAIKLYEKYGFRRVPPFGNYTDDPLSLCYEKPVEKLSQTMSASDALSHNDYTEANRQMWNETADVHAQVRGDKLLQAVVAPDFSTFKPIEKRLFAEIGLQGKSVIQLACNNGREIISVKKAGAARCVGVDISDKFIAQARELADAGMVDVEFIRSSVYDLPSDLDGQSGLDGHFDLVYITIGALGWMPDLNRFFEIIARLLKPGGQALLYEVHPILNMFDPDKGLEIRHSYFQAEPFVEGASPDYLDPTKIVSSTSYWFPHKISDVISACINHGMSVTHFQEYPDDISAAFASFEQFENRPPLRYSLIAEKKRP